jgi:hypothetical protein
MHLKLPHIWLRPVCENTPKFLPFPNGGTFMQLNFPNGKCDTRSRMLCDTVFSTVQSGTIVPTLRRHYNIHHQDRCVGTYLSLIYQVHNGKFLRNVRHFCQKDGVTLQKTAVFTLPVWVSQISPEDVSFAAVKCQIAWCWAAVYDAVLTARIGTVPNYFGHDPLRSYLNTFDTFIMIIPILDTFIIIISILDTFIMIIPIYLGHVHYDHPYLTWTRS